MRFSARKIAETDQQIPCPAAVHKKNNNNKYGTVEILYGKASSRFLPRVVIPRLKVNLPPSGIRGRKPLLKATLPAVLFIPSGWVTIGVSSLGVRGLRWLEMESENVGPGVWHSGFGFPLLGQSTVDGIIRRCQTTTEMKHGQVAKCRLRVVSEGISIRDGSSLLEKKVFRPSEDTTVGEKMECRRPPAPLEDCLGVIPITRKGPLPRIPLPNPSINKYSLRSFRRMPCCTKYSPGSWHSSLLLAKLAAATVLRGGGWV